MITVEQYFGQYAGRPEITQKLTDSAALLLAAVNTLLDRASADGVTLYTNPHTSSKISGQMNGGWRPRNCPIGASDSSHKQARGIDIYDPLNAIDRWITDVILTEFDVYREAPEYTTNWCHLTNRPPKSQLRTFLP